MNLRGTCEESAISNDFNCLSGGSIGRGIAHKIIGVSLPKRKVVAQFEKTIPRRLKPFLIFSLRHD